MTADNQNHESSAMFTLLVMNFQSSAMMSLGKLINPVTQKIERNLDQAKFSIDLLGMLEAKTKGNLSSDEEQLLRRVLTELRLNYVDELEKDKATAGEGNRPEGDTPATETAGDSQEQTGAPAPESQENAVPRAEEKTAGREKKETGQGITDKKKRTRKGSKKTT